MKEIPAKLRRNRSGSGIIPAGLWVNSNSKQLLLMLLTLIPMTVVSSSARSETVVLSETFENALVTEKTPKGYIVSGNNSWFAINSSSEVNERPSPTIVIKEINKISGPCAHFNGWSSNSGIAANFPIVPLSKEGDFVELSFDMAFEHLPLSSSYDPNFGLQFGIYDSNRTKLANNIVGRSQVDGDDVGYRVYKNPYEANNDIILVAQGSSTYAAANPQSNGAGGAILQTSNSGVLLDVEPTSHSMALKIELLAQGRLKVKYKVDGVEQEYTTAGASEVLTTNFDQILINIGNNTDGHAAYLDNIKVTTNAAR